MSSVYYHHPHQLDVVKTSVCILGASIAGAALYFWWSASGTKRPYKSHRDCPNGLHNIGTTCYANALLQALSSTPGVLNWLRRLPLDTLADPRRAAVLGELRRLVAFLNDTSAENAESAGGLIDALERYHGWHIGTHIEQDLLELLNVFVSAWDDELTFLLEEEKNNVPGLLMLKESASESQPDPEDIKCSYDRRKNILYDELKFWSEIRAPCHGYMATQLQCRQCGLKRIKHDAFCTLSLSLPHGGSDSDSLSLEHLLRKFFTIEVLHELTCSACCAGLKANLRLDALKRLAVSQKHQHATNRRSSPSTAARRGSASVSNGSRRNQLSTPGVLDRA